MTKNICRNCDYDMGESYENCGSSEDGICPQCGHDEDMSVILAGDHCKEFEIGVVEGDNLLVWRDDENGLWYLDRDSEGFTTLDQLYKKLEETI